MAGFLIGSVPLIVLCFYTSRWCVKDLPLDTIKV